MLILLINDSVIESELLLFMCFLLLSLQSCFDANDLCRCINERISSSRTHTHTSTQRIKKQVAKKCMKIDSLALWDFIVFRFRIFFCFSFSLCIYVDGFRYFVLNHLNGANAVRCVFIHIISKENPYIAIP